MGVNTERQRHSLLLRELTSYLGGHVSSTNVSLTPLSHCAYSMCAWICTGIPLHVIKTSYGQRKQTSTARGSWDISGVRCSKSNLLFKYSTIKQSMQMHARFLAVPFSAPRRIDDAEQLGCDV